MKKKEKRVYDWERKRYVQREEQETELVVTDEVFLVISFDSFLAIKMVDS